MALCQTALCASAPSALLQPAELEPYRKRANAEYSKSADTVERFYDMKNAEEKSRSLAVTMDPSHQLLSVIEMVDDENVAAAVRKVEANINVGSKADELWSGMESAVDVRAKLNGLQSVTLQIIYTEINWSSVLNHIIST